MSELEEIYFRNVNLNIVWNVKDAVLKTKKTN